jgi:hypothetical protein
MRLCGKYLVAVAVMGALLAGCGQGAHLGAENEKRSNMDLQGAASRADGILDATVSAIEPEIKWAHGVTTAGSCDVTRRRVVMTFISEARRGSFLGVVERFWLDSNYVVKSVNSSKKFPAIYAQSADGFGISLSIGDKGQAFFEVDSPCVEGSAVAEPTTKPNGPDYRGGPIPRPNVRSDFWSAESSGQPSPSAP